MRVIAARSKAMLHDSVKGSHKLAVSGADTPSAALILQQVLRGRHGRWNEVVM